MLLTIGNRSPENLRKCDQVALGCAVMLLREYGHTNEEFIAAHPELWRPIIPAEPFRKFLAGSQVIL